MADAPQARVQPLFTPTLPAPERGLSVLEAVAAIASARILALIALLGSVAIWGWVAYEPTILGLWTGAGVSMGVLVPCLWLSWKKG